MLNTRCYYRLRLADYGRWELPEAELPGADRLSHDIGYDAA